MKVINTRSHGLLIGGFMFFLTQLSHGAPPSPPSPPPLIPPLLSSIAVTPINPTINIGLTQAFTATGTYSDASQVVMGTYATAIVVGGDHSCALIAGGAVKCWGFNAYGQLGDGTTTDSGTPVTVSGISTAIAVSTGSSFLGLGGDHSCALLANGQVQCWGENSAGQLGNGTTISSITPVTVSGISTATAIATGTYHTCALLADGTVQCWGANAPGQLGGGYFSSPVTVSGINTATAIAAGTYHTCVLLADGTVQCWGANIDGMLGNGTATASSTPVDVIGISTATAIAVGTFHSCALLASGQVQCWGANLFGQLGNGTTTDSSTPVTVSGISAAIAIAAAGDHSIALLADGSVQLWGDIAIYNVPVPNYSTGPVTVSGFTTTVTAIATGPYHSCALLISGQVQCWSSGLLVNDTVNGIGVVWSSSDPSVATIDANGLAHGLIAGTTTITATAGSISGSTTLFVATGSASTYSISGTISGLAGSVVLKDNGTDNLSLSKNGSFTFPTALASGAAYNVTVATQPAGQTCAVSNGSGTVSNSAVTNVTVNCSSNSASGAPTTSSSNSGGGGGGATSPLMLALLGFILATRRAHLRPRSA